MSNMDIVIPARDAKIRRYLWLALLLPALLVAAFYLSGMFGGGRVLRVAEDSVTLHSVKMAEFVESISVLATAEPVRSVVLSTAVGGRLEQLNFLSGTYVEKGDEIARLSNAALELEVLTRATEVAQQISNLYNFELVYQNRELDLQNQQIAVEAELEKAQLRLTRLEDLFAKGFATREDLDNAKIEVRSKESLRASVIRAREDFEILKASQSSDFKKTTDNLTAGLALARKRQDDLVIRAPISGILSDVDAVPGIQIPVGEIIGRIKGVEDVILRARPSEFYLNKIDGDSTAMATVAGENYPLTLVQVSPTVSDNSFQVDFKIPDNAKKVRLGQTVPVKINLSSPRRAVLTPATPFWNDVGVEGVFVYDPATKTAVRRKVVLGSRNETHIEIRDGLKDGDIVIGLNYEEAKGYERIELE